MDFSQLFGPLSDTEQKLVQVFFQHIQSDDKIHIAPYIPKNKLINAQKSFAPVPEGEKVLAVIDGTLDGTASMGLVLTLRGIYWTKEILTDKESMLCYEDIYDASIYTGIRRGIRVNNRVTPSAFLSKASMEGLVNFLGEAAEICTAEKEGIEADDRDAEEEWHIGVNGQVYGPYTLAVIRNMIDAHSIIPENCLGWKDGMSEWEPFMDIDELAVLASETDEEMVSEESRNNAGDSEEEANERIAEKSFSVGLVEWHIGVDGQSHGPYSVENIEKMLKNHEIEAENCLVWKDGMKEWRPFMAVSEMAGLVNRKNMQPQPVAKEEKTDGSGPDAPVNINTATADELLVLPGITLELAEKLVIERQEKRLFFTVEEVGEFLKLQPHQVERIRRQVIFTAPTYGGRKIDF